jgi:hypothetical protein
MLGAGFALAQGVRRRDKADAFFDDREVREIRIYFDDPNWYGTLVAAHEYVRLGYYGNQWAVSSEPAPGRENRVSEE